MDIITYLPDITASLILIIFAVIGIKRGFVRSLLHSASFFIAIIVCFCFANPITSWILRSDLGVSIKKSVYDLVLTPVTEAPEMLLSDMNLPDFLIKGISESKPVIDIAETLSHNISNTVISVAVFVLLFFVTKLALKILTKALDLVTGLPILKQLNSFLGGIMGIITGILWVYVILTIIAAFSFAPQMETVVEFITKSKILSFLYENNIVVGLFS